MSVYYRDACYVPFSILKKNREKMCIIENLKNDTKYSTKKQTKKQKKIEKAGKIEGLQDGSGLFIIFTQIEKKIMLEFMYFL